MMRRLDFEGCFNFRDLGGWRTRSGGHVRWGRLFRADAVHLMTPGDVRRATDELGIGTLSDLRSEPEIAHGGPGALAELVAARHHLALSTRRAAAIDATVVAASSSDRSPDAMVGNYLTILEASSDLVVAAVQALSDPDTLPGLFFCAAGKDRTGVLSAVVLGALDVHDDDVVEDYVLTGEAIEPIITRFSQTPGAAAMYRDLPPSHFAPYRETMERVVAEIGARYGSFADYLLAKGLSDASLASLRAALVEAP